MQFAGTIGGTEPHYCETLIRTGVVVRGITDGAGPVGREGTDMPSNRLLARFLFAGVVAVPAGSVTTASRTPRAEVSAVEEEIDDDGVDAAIERMVVTTLPVVAAQKLRALLENMSPFDATRAASVAALSDNVGVRRAVADALAWPFRLVGETFLLEQLMVDPDLDVRIAARAAARIRYA